MLTQADLKQLGALFRRDEHEVKQNKFAYIAETAITVRLSEVDPSWEWQIISISRGPRAAVAHGRLTICGVTRDGIGMQDIEYTKNGNLDAANVLIEAGEAEKAAATDALRRAARLFGVGRYLLDAPNGDAFWKWIDEAIAYVNKRDAEAGKNAPPAVTSTPTQAASTQQAQSTTQAKTSAADTEFDALPKPEWAGWTPELAQELAKWAIAEYKVDNPTILKVLNVSRVGQYKGTFTDAQAAISTHALAAVKF